MLQRAQQRNPVLVLGASGLIGIDIDGRDGAQLLHQIHPDPLPRTVTVETGNGFHFWYQRPAGITNTAKIEEHGKRADGCGSARESLPARKSG